MQEFCEHGMPQPAGNDWVRQARMRRIKAKMLKVAKKPRQMFELLDTDGGGSLDSKELAVGLFRLGIWCVLIIHTYVCFPSLLHAYIPHARIHVSVCVCARALV